MRIYNLHAAAMEPD